jgi:hypothetical protein
MSLHVFIGVTLLFLAVPPFAAEPPAVESYKYTFPYKEMWGTSKHPVGDYADISHKVGPVSSKSSDRYNYKSRRELGIDIVTTDAATLRLDAKLVERGEGEDNATLFDEILEELIDMQLGWDTSVHRSARGTLSTSFAPDVVWELAVSRYSPNMEPGSVIALLVYGDRKIQFVEQKFGLIDVFEEGDWLSSGADREYTFREDLDPELKLVLLGGMEAVKISIKFHDSLH